MNKTSVLNSTVGLKRTRMRTTVFSRETTKQVTNIPQAMRAERGSALSG